MPGLIEITHGPIAPEEVISRAKTSGSGCVATYVGVIRDNSCGKAVATVEYQDPDGKAAENLKALAVEAMKRWPLENVAFTHRVGKLKPGDINLVIAVAAGHRQEGFAACQFLIDRFKESLPTRKTETYTDGTTLTGGD
jgi:molybdopterin synthase catalytic subunit